MTGPEVFSGSWLSFCGVDRVRPVEVVLVTGMSGAGKSMALAELAQRGHQVVDTDDGDWIEDVPAFSIPASTRSSWSLRHLMYSWSG